ncbi:hypothetical protein M6B38_321955 [Iris pallida]|uniref:Uncharacterized protein n=1 Tax=Iris pallida TaxID=29817 RepID=A0AAX6HB29_IRIPA|nr:hypothetical protein M6B38_321955 [Iris pallida]
MTRRARPRRRGAGRAAASARRPDRRRGEGSADLNLVTPIDGGRLHSSAVVVSISSMTVSTRMGCDMAPRLQAMSIISGENGGGGRERSHRLQRRGGFELGGAPVLMWSPDTARQLRR